MKLFAVLKTLALTLVLLTGNAIAADKVDINAATASELERALVGVGAAKASAIVEYREANGPFKSAEELALVKGIGLKTVERNRDLIMVGERKAARNTATAPKPASQEAARGGVSRR